MAEEFDGQEKTEEPSQHRIDEARKKGEVAVSKELTSVLLLAAVILTLVLASLYMLEVMADYIRWMFKIDAAKAYTDETLQLIFRESFIATAKCVAPVLLVAACIGVLSQIAQVGLLFSPEVLSLKFDRVNPINGVKRLFSKKAIVEAIKGVFKFAVILSITYFILGNHMNTFSGFFHVDSLQAFLHGKSIIAQLMFSILLGLSLIALADFAWEKYSYKQKMMMTKEQAKQESKERDGNPEIKQRIRSAQREIASKRLTADVESADVIITNPTHISIAVKYDPATMVAPLIVAKGSDHLAMRIREIAKKKEVTIVENIPLARTLYKTTKAGEGVPRTLYKAVAEILAFVYRLKRKKKALS